MFQVLVYGMGGSCHFEDFGGFRGVEGGDLQDLWFSGVYCFGESILKCLQYGVVISMAMRICEAL